MILAQDGGERFSECELRNRRLIRQRSLGSRCLDFESLGIRPGFCKPEIDELEHRFKISSRCAAGQAFFGFSDKRTHIGDLAGHQLPQIDCAEVAHPAGAQNLRSRAGGDVILVGRQRRAARACSAEHDFVFPECRWFENDLYTIRQFPLGDPDRFFRGGLHDSTAGRQWIEQSCRCDVIDIGFKILARRGFDDRRKLCFIRHH